MDRRQQKVCGVQRESDSNSITSSYGRQDYGLLIQFIFQQDILQLFRQNVLICLQVGSRHAPARNFKINTQTCTWNRCSTITPTVSGQKVFHYMTINLEHSKGYLSRKGHQSWLMQEKRTNLATTWK